MIKTFINNDRAADADEIARQLSDFNPYKRHQARLALEAMGEAVVPTLINYAHHPDWHVRWEIVKALGEMGDPHAADALVDRLFDDETSVRWAAMSSLARMGREGIRPLMTRLTADFGSRRFCEGAHHVLHLLKDHELLTENEIQVFCALEGAAPGIQAAWAARAALGL